MLTTASVATASPACPSSVVWDYNCALDFNRYRFYYGIIDGNRAVDWAEA